MNLRHLLFRRMAPAAARDSASASVPPAGIDAGAETGDNIVPLRVPPSPGFPEPSPRTEAAPGAPGAEEAATSQATVLAPHGMPDAPELIAFFNGSHLGLGRHDGSHYRTQEARETGREALIARFMNLLDGVAARRQAEWDRLQDALLQTEGVCPVTTRRLRLAASIKEREIALLREQSERAAQGQGWVLEALTSYQIGFAKGLREALEFELLGH
ncbi:hypothetical protein [Caldimonas tepidiphila]|uniref:hypothetical protein n=1 Tax=Caldimonas tepidiphila TaxID=2315841 RepID=UPI000E5B6F7C|nr:hypothetical protein [Caldimonas tepidiphila]